MELLLNFVWICVSATLIVWQIRAARAKSGGPDSGPGSDLGWRVPVALAILLLLLLPVISITDDLMAMTAAADVEHMLRRPLEPEQQAPMLAVVELIGAAALLLHRLRQQRILEMVSRSDSGLVRLMQGLVRVSRVRPPPVAISL